MNSETKKLKTGNENSIIIIILAVLLVIVLAIVGVYVAKDNAGIATFDGGKVKKLEYKVYYQMFSSYLQYYGYSQDEIPYQIALKAATDKMILTDAKAAGVKLSAEGKEEVDNIFNDESYVEYFKGLGFDLDDLREVYYNDYIIQDYIKKLANEASVEDIQNHINSKYDEGETINMTEYDTSHILFSFTDADGNALSDDAKAALKTEAEAILNRALSGEDFATLATENSDDTATAVDGGKYKVYDDGNTVDEYAAVAMALEVGKVHPQLVETSYGYHIIKLNAKTENGRVNNSLEREEYANTLFDNLEEDKNLVIDEEKLKEFVLEIDPSAYAEESTGTETDTTTDTTTEQ